MKTAVELTDVFVRSVRTDKTRLNIADLKSAGLKLRVSRTVGKVFALMVRDQGGRNRTYTIGKYPDISVKQARQIADRMRVEVRYDGASAPSLARPAPSERLSLSELLDEVEPVFARNRKSWRPRGIRKGTPHARSTIEKVFASLLDRPILTLTEIDFSNSANNYSPIKPRGGKTTATGQVSRAISYLAPVFDWAAGRGKRFAKIGAGRSPQLKTPDLSKIHDPSVDDPTITGFRDRVLTEAEISSVLPLLQYPRPPEVRRRNVPAELDYGPIALRFLFLTLARREEVAIARWCDFNLCSGVWIKPDVKSTNGPRRNQHLPLSAAAIALLKSLPGSTEADRNAFVFPNSEGGKLDNWNRICSAIQSASGTSGWTRHDIRRTGSTLLEELGVPPQTIDAILGHANRLARAEVSGSAGHYMTATRIMKAMKDPKAVALDMLAEAYELLSSGPAWGGSGWSLSGTRPEAPIYVGELALPVERAGPLRRVAKFSCWTTKSRSVRSPSGRFAPSATTSRSRRVLQARRPGSGSASR